MEQLVETSPHCTAETHQEFFRGLYEAAFPAVARFVRQQGGSRDDARDVFHDAMILLYERINEGKMVVRVSHEAYLLGIAKHLWIRNFNKLKNEVHLVDFDAGIEISESYFSTEADHTLLRLLERAGKKCLELLSAFYYDKTSLHDISASFGFSGTRSATAQKFKCIEKLRGMVKQHMIKYEDLTD